MCDTQSGPSLGCKYSLDWKWEKSDFSTRWEMDCGTQCGANHTHSSDSLQSFITPTHHFNIPSFFLFFSPRPSIFWPVTQLGPCLWWTEPIKLCALAQTGMHLIMVQCSFPELNTLRFSCIHYCLLISHHSLETRCCSLLYCNISAVLMKHHNVCKLLKSPFRDGSFYCHLVLLYAMNWTMN